MLVVLEKLVDGRDGLVRIGRKTWSYKTIAAQSLSRESGFSPLAIWAMVHGCDKLTVIDGKQVWESSIDSSRMFLEAGI